METQKSKLYFASDFHLGAPNDASSREREAWIVSWLDHIKHDAAELFLLGDVFDFWFEYATAVPKGFIRLQGKLAELSDAGTKIYFFKGNHDMWVFDYFKKEFGMQIISDELFIERQGKKFLLHHGDGLGPGDVSYKLLKKIFRSKFCQWLFARLHPNLGIGIANYWSSKSRLASYKKEGAITQQREETFIKSFYKQLKHDYGNFDHLVMGHRHFPTQFKLDEETHYTNLGEWVNYAYYGVFDGVELKLLDWKKHHEK
ncbi:UDP-2,3-diacylglucosamine diphosphatase [Pedobacter aquae]|uniref:UDP-2,3-diacylglucosamine diphosphatase n=1 Tax=Pedobacter aquae TaxID=2605747 RepID=A0A5C0VMJ1_9SPHI|nr:UDP-2,3-diacylglucosamine diphosphatase [Pedobacter aquae]QEK52470.1 UDP-2,3-diacylglucosamine diphosphatase [Pedobacter aquae]